MVLSGVARIILSVRVLRRFNLLKKFIYFFFACFFMAKRRKLYAGFWLRFFAWIIDKIVIAGLMSVITAVLGVVIPGVFKSLSSWSYDLLVLLVGWLYYALMESSVYQATLGKMVFDLKVTDLDKKPVSFLRASARFFGKILSGMILGIGFLMIAFTDKKQGLHDKLAGCLVIRKK